MMPMKAMRPRLAHAVTSALPALFLIVMAVGCIPLAESDESRDPRGYSEFLTPVAEAEDAGVRLYWLGEQFEVGSIPFRLAGASEFVEEQYGGPGVIFAYSGDTGGGHVAFTVGSYSAQRGGAAVLRERVLAVQGATSQRVRVGNWEGELLSLPAGTRPVNQLVLIVDIGNTIVVGRAFSGGTGIPGEDANPLIQADLLIEVMEQLRPYAE